MGKLRGALLLVGVAACAARQPTAGPPAPPPSLAPAQIARLIDGRVRDRAAWGQAIADALQALGRAADPPSVCAVVAVIAQESGFQEDPVVPGLARIVQARLASYEGKLGPLGGPVFRRLLSARSPADPRTFDERLHQARTERDVDRVFRDMLAYYQSSFPLTVGALGLAGKLFDVHDLGELNPVTTAGPMQVSVRFAESWARQHHGDPTRVRDDLYTREAGTFYGTARLLAYEAAYPKMLFRFADYNAGLYASRNAALQAQLSRLAGEPLALDGDLLAYGRDGEPKEEPSRTLLALRRFRDRYGQPLSDETLDADLRLEKTFAFEATATYRAVRRAFADRFGETPAYAILPQVALTSPKISRKLTTAWYAETVDRRFQSCLASVR